MLSNLQISRPSIYLGCFFFISQLINGFNDARNSYSVISNYWYAVAFFWALNWWFLADSRKHGAGWTDGHLDMGLFLYIAGFFMAPYYLFKTRGWKAIYTIGLFLGTIFGAYIAGIVFYQLLNNF